MSKNIFITGATGNLGSAVVNFLFEQGYQLIGTSRSGKSKSDKISLYECDLTDEGSVSACFQQVKATYPKLDGAVLLAGGFAMGGILDSDKEDLLKMYTINFLTTYLTSRECIQWMHETGGGKIIFTGAKPALEGGGSGVLPYALSKSSVISLADLINTDENLSNIHASVIVPSTIDTPANRQAMPDSNFGDWVSPHDIAANIDYLLSDRANALRHTILKLYGNA